MMKQYSNRILGTVQAGPLSDNLHAVNPKTAEFLASIGGNYWVAKANTDTIVLTQDQFDNAFSQERVTA